jgi:hypothetical protein
MMIPKYSAADPFPVILFIYKDFFFLLFQVVSVMAIITVRLNSILISGEPALLGRPAMRVGIAHASRLVRLLSRKILIGEGGFMQYGILRDSRIESVLF